MRKLTTSLLATAVLAGGVLTGAAVASPGQPQHATTEARSADRAVSARHESSRDQARQGSTSRERSSHMREAASAHER